MTTSISWRIVSSWPYQKKSAKVETLPQISLEIHVIVVDQSKSVVKQNQRSLRLLSKLCWKIIRCHITIHTSDDKCTYSSSLIPSFISETSPKHKEAVSHNERMHV